MKRYLLAGLSVSGGILSGLGWTQWCSGLILLISFVPFILIENYLSENSRLYSNAAFFTYLLPGFVVFSIITLSWIRVVSIAAAICVILTASFLMSFTMWLAHIIKLRAGNLTGIISLIGFWLTLEFLCLRINILSPWINLGNGLSKDILFIQWYEVTGSSGGTLWILTSNLLLAYSIIRFVKKKGNASLNFGVWLLAIILPSTVSVILFKTVKSDGNPVEVVIVQPNFDPYSEKFTTPFNIQLGKALEMAEDAITESTEWVVFPETLVDDPADENHLWDNKYILMIKGLIENHPGINAVAGFASYRSGTDIPLSDYYNSAFKIDSGSSIQIYHKSKLVPGFETYLSDGPLKFLVQLLPELGGTNRGYTPQGERTCLTGNDRSFKIAPVICYESVYGEFVSKYVRNGADAIFIITNDGWWKNSNGYRQHFSFSSLRAIETRRPVVRSANTGISGFTDIRGKYIQKTGWWIPATLRGTIETVSRMTFYVKYGDYLMYLGCVLSVLILLMTFVYLPFRDKVT